jgi:hypothetical protein
VAKVALIGLVGVLFVGGGFAAFLQEGKFSVGGDPGTVVAEREVPAQTPAATQVVAVAETQEGRPPEAERAREVAVVREADVPATRPEPSTRADPAFSPEIQWIQTVAGNYANIRASGSSQAPILGMVKPGDPLELEDSAAGWRRVKAGGTSGWVWVPVLNLPSDL